MGSKQQRKKKIKVLKDEEIATNKGNEAQHQRERRQRIRDLNNILEDKTLRIPQWMMRLKMRTQ